MAKTKTAQMSDKEKNIALILAILGIFGVAGIHRFYTGKFWTGLLWLITGGVFLIGTIIDIVMIANGDFQDKSGAVVRR